MNRIMPDLLSHTLNVVQLARETAAAKGNAAQAERLTPVANNLKDLVASQRQPPSVPPTGMMGQSDFQVLLNVSNEHPAAVSPASNASDRNSVVNAMGAAGMNVTDIARHMGMAQDEIRLILDVNTKNRPDLEVLR